MESDPPASKKAAEWKLLVAMRILVTGSRDWQDMDFIFKKLTELTSDEVGHTLVHGDCPTGADFYANIWAECQPDVIIEKYPAGWDTFGRAGGPIRNKYMVSLGADICLAFIKDKSRGATGTAEMAEKVGIRVIRYEC